MTYQLRIDLKLPYKNELTPSIDRSAFFRYQEVKRTWWKAIPDPSPSQRAEGARRLTVMRLMTPHERKFDTGNIYYACAALIDILVKKGWFIGDEPDLLDLEKPVQRLAGADEVAPATWFEIEDLPGAAVLTPNLPGIPRLPPIAKRRRPRTLPPGFEKQSDGVPAEINPRCDRDSD